MNEFIQRIGFHTALIAVVCIIMVQILCKLGMECVQFTAISDEGQYRIGLLTVPLQLIQVGLRDRKVVMVLDQPAQSFQRKKEDAVRFLPEFIQQIRVPSVLRDGAVESYYNEPAVKAFGPVAAILRDAVAGKEKSCAGPE